MHVFFCKTLNFYFSFFVTLQSEFLYSAIRYVATPWKETVVQKCFFPESEDSHTWTEGSMRGFERKVYKTYAIHFV